MSDHTDDMIIRDALAKHPDCTYGAVYTECLACYKMTRVVKLWRNEECYLADDPPKHVVEGYPGYGK